VIPGVAVVLGVGVSVMVGVGVPVGVTVGVWVGQTVKEGSLVKQSSQLPNGPLVKSEITQV
jgi:hypothetical protein